MDPVKVSKSLNTHNLQEVNGAFFRKGGKPVVNARI